MTKESRQGLRRFRVEVRSWGNYVEQIAELKRVLAKKPRTLQFEIIGTGEISADSALRFRMALMDRSPKTRVVTNAHSTIQGVSVLLWLLGDSRTIREDARLHFRRTTLSDDDEVQVNGACQDEQPAYRDSYSTIDPDEGDYARMLQIIIQMSRWPSSPGSGLQNREERCNSFTGLQFHSSIGVERYTLVAVRQDLPNRNTGRNTLMLDQPSPRLRLGGPFHFPQLNLACRQV